MKFLIVEDEKNLNDLLYEYIKNSYEEAAVDQILDGNEALLKIQEKDYDVVLLDVMLPGIDGFEIAKKLRETSDTPILMLSALNDEENQIRGYNLGIDEYIPKPYSPRLVMKKITAILQRYEGMSGDVITYGVISYSPKHHTLLIDEKPVELNKKEWDLLTLFLHNPGRLFSRDDLLNKVWGFDYFGDARTVDTHIKRLRQKLGIASSYVKTVFKEGYKFEK